MDKAVNKEQYMNFIAETLIPDLMESGTVHTAADLTRAWIFLKYPKSTHVSDFAVHARMQEMFRESYHREYEGELP